MNQFLKLWIFWWLYNCNKFSKARTGTETKPHNPIDSIHNASFKRQCLKVQPVIQNWLCAVLSWAIRSHPCMYDVSSIRKGNNRGNRCPSKYRNRTTNTVSGVAQWMVECWSLTGELSLSCARLLAGRMITLWVRRPLSVSQHGQLSHPSLMGR